jgi:hypothetical protein
MQRLKTLVADSFAAQENLSVAERKDVRVSWEAGRGVMVQYREGQQWSNTTCGVARDAKTAEAAYLRTLEWLNRALLVQMQRAHAALMAAGARGPSAVPEYQAQLLLDATGIDVVQHIRPRERGGR